MSGARRGYAFHSLLNNNKNNNNNQHYLPHSLLPYLDNRVVQQQHQPAQASQEWPPGLSCKSAINGSGKRTISNDTNIIVMDTPVGLSVIRRANIGTLR